MKCSCAQCPHLTFFYISILSKVLFWYRVVAAGNCPRSGTENDASSNRSQTSSSTQEVSPPPAGQFSVRPTLIQIGILDLDQEDQANLRCVILLRELRKVEKAIDEMTSVNRSTDHDAGDPASHAAKWSLLGISKIRDELQDTIQKVKQSRDQG